MDGWADTTDSTMFKYNEKKRNKEKWRKMKKNEKKMNEINLSSVEKQTKNGD